MSARPERPERLVQILAAMTEPQAARALRAASDHDVLGAARNFTEWTHDGQDAPATCLDGSDWQTWVLMAGRGFGKTRAGAEWIAQAVRGSDARGESSLRIALVAATLDEARRVMVEGASGLLAVAADQIAAWAPSRRLLQFTSGA